MSAFSNLSIRLDERMILEIAIGFTLFFSYCVYRILTSRVSRKKYYLVACILGTTVFFYLSSLYLNGTLNNLSQSDVVVSTFISIIWLIVFSLEFVKEKTSKRIVYLLPIIIVLLYLSLFVSHIYLLSTGEFMELL